MRIIFSLPKILVFSFLFFFFLIIKYTTNFLNLKIILYVLNSISFFNENSYNKFLLLYLFFYFASIQFFNHLFNELQLEIYYCETCTASIPTPMTVHDHKSSENKRLRILRWTKHYRHAQFYKLFIIRFGRFSFRTS